MSRNPRISRETAAAIKAAVRRGLDGLKAEPRQRLADWAAQFFVMAGESSQQKGGWLAWVFQIGMMDFMSDDRIEDLYIVKSKRVGYTKMVTAFVAYCVAHLRRNLALWQPTDDDRDSYVKSEIDPVLDQIEAVRTARKVGGKDADTIKLKQFRNSVVHLLGGKAARAYRRITVAVAILDEWSKFDARIEKTGDAKGLAKGRLEGAPYPKFIGGTTPLLKGLDQAETACELAEGLVRFHIECPLCGVDHPLTWGGKDKAHGFRWEPGKPETVRHVCPHCLRSITQADYLKQCTPAEGRWTLGAWVCGKTGKRYGSDRTWRDDKGMPCKPPATLGVHVWSAYSPQRSWPSIVKEFLEALAASAKGDHGPLQLFTNETLGETWELKGERSDDHALQARAKAEGLPIGTVPKGALVLTAGVDVQRDRWEIGVWGWARGMESWTVDHAIIEGNPANEEDWQRVTAYLQRRYPQAWHGGSLGLSAISVDSSDQSQAVYNWCRQAQHTLPVLSAVKGSSEDHKPILMPSSSLEINWKGQKWVNGLKLWLVGTDTAKDLLLGQLAIEQPGPGHVHMAADLPREWFEQLTAEQRVLTKINGKDAYRWLKRRQRNEVLDCRVYAMHAAFRLGLHDPRRYGETRWKQIESAVQPDADLFSAAGGAPRPDVSDVLRATSPQPPQQQPSRRPGPQRPAGRIW
jgi:phage terminase large subunit GpA-like protein